jgi:hypothetical protein
LRLRGGKGELSNPTLLLKNYVEEVRLRDTNEGISMKTLIIKSLLPSLCQREEMYPSLAKRGEGRFFNNDALLMNSLVSGISKIMDCFQRKV